MKHECLVGLCVVYFIKYRNKGTHEVTIPYVGTWGQSNGGVQ